jgi:hypothetical protein
MEDKEMTYDDFYAMQEQLEKNYNEICTVAMLDIFQMTGLSQKEPDDNTVIPIHNLNLKNPEHLFVLSAARALGGILGLQVAVDINPIRLAWMNRKAPKNSRLLHLKKKDQVNALNPDDLLCFMRPWATDLCGDDFYFGDIYYEFYAAGGKN